LADSAFFQNIIDAFIFWALRFNKVSTCSANLSRIWNYRDFLGGAVIMSQQNQLIVVPDYPILSIKLYGLASTKVPTPWPLNHSRQVNCYLLVIMDLSTND
jgi:hypothetical protein